MCLEILLFSQKYSSWAHTHSQNTPQKRPINIIIYELIYYSLTIENVNNPRITKWIQSTGRMAAVNIFQSPNMYGGYNVLVNLLHIVLFF